MCKLPSEIEVPSRSTIYALQDPNGLVKCRGRSRNKAHGTALSAGTNPNDLWCADLNIVQGLMGWAVPVVTYVRMASPSMQ